MLKKNRRHIFGLGRLVSPAASHHLPFLYLTATICLKSTPARHIDWEEGQELSEKGTNNGSNERPQMQGAKESRTESQECHSSLGHHSRTTDVSSSKASRNQYDSYQDNLRSTFASSPIGSSRAGTTSSSSRLLRMARLAQEAASAKSNSNLQLKERTKVGKASAGSTITDTEQAVFSKIISSLHEETISAPATPPLYAKDGSRNLEADQPSKNADRVAGLLQYLTATLPARPEAKSVASAVVSASKSSPQIDHPATNEHRHSAEDGREKTLLFKWAIPEPKTAFYQDLKSRINHAKTDEEVWNILTEAVFPMAEGLEPGANSINEHDKGSSVISSNQTIRGGRKRGRPVKREKIVKARKKQSLAPESEAIQQPESKTLLTSEREARVAFASDNLSGLLLHATYTLLALHAPQYVLALYDKLKALGPLSHVLGASTPLYNALIHICSGTAAFEPPPPRTPKMPEIRQLRDMTAIVDKVSLFSKSGNTPKHVLPLSALQDWHAVDTLLREMLDRLALDPDATTLALIARILRLADAERRSSVPSYLPNKESAQQNGEHQNHSTLGAERWRGVLGSEAIAGMKHWLRTLTERIQARASEVEEEQRLKKEVEAELGIGPESGPTPEPEPVSSSTQTSAFSRLQDSIESQKQKLSVRDAVAAESLSGTSGSKSDAAHDEQRVIFGCNSQASRRSAEEDWPFAAPLRRRKAKKDAVYAAAAARL